MLLIYGCSATKTSAVRNNPHYTELSNMHTELNEKHGRTNSYYATLAAADGYYEKAYALHYKGCKRGSVIECLNTYYVGRYRSLSAYDSKAFANDLKESLDRSLSACDRDISYGCANVFFAFEALNDDDDFISSIITPELSKYSDERIANKALNLTQKECDNNDATSCFLYATILRTMDNYADIGALLQKELKLGYVLAPLILINSGAKNIDYFQSICDLDEPLSCRYAAFLFEKYEKDTKSAIKYHKKACSLGMSSSCDDINRIENANKKDETGSPVIERR